MLSPREPSTSASVGEHTLPLASCALGAAQPGHHRHQLRSHRLRGTVDTCRRPGLFRRPKRHRIAAQICRVDRPLFSLTCTATAATMTASLQGNEHTFGT